MLKEWVMILQILVTNQVIALDVGSEEECRTAMARITAGEKMEVTTKDGIRLPIERHLGCRRKDEMAGGVS